MARMAKIVEQPGLHGRHRMFRARAGAGAVLAAMPELLPGRDLHRTAIPAGRVPVADACVHWTDVSGAEAAQLLAAARPAAVPLPV